MNEIGKVLAARLAIDPAVRAVVRARAQQALVRAQRIGWELEEGEAYVDSLRLDRQTLISSHPDARVIEFGGADRRAKAPLRKAAASVGARVVMIRA